MEAASSRPEWLIRVYVVGMTPTAETTLRNLREICRDHLDGRARIEIIDLEENPQLAADHKIFAVPTVVRHLPEPVRKVIGDLSDREKALVGLDLRASS